MIHSLFKISRISLLGLLPFALAGCVLEPLPPPGPPMGPPVAYAAPCCYAFPQYPGYYGPGVVSFGSYYGERWHGGGYWRR
jgi:hypothetical protein